MIHVTTPDKSRNIGYKINHLGLLKIISVAPKVDSSKASLVKNGKYDQSSVLETEFRFPKDAWVYSSMASLIVGTGNNVNSVNIIYNNPPKTQGKPNRFDVDTVKIKSL